ncbi:unnamed protein product [Moneuplotes crassus]|uniref:Uncharacterized protein n=1 Tax=Euplotes crassus TaxID=5936 RepID=A0AAD1XX51_EUPCR|nr:unnamed protein product [Moneuplotes crassus]
MQSRLWLTYPSRPSTGFLSDCRISSSRRGRGINTGRRCGDSGPLKSREWKCLQMKEQEHFQALPVLKARTSWYWRWCIKTALRYSGHCVREGQRSFKALGEEMRVPGGLKTRIKEDFVISTPNVVLQSPNIISNSRLCCSNCSQKLKSLAREGDNLYSYQDLEKKKLHTLIAAGYTWLSIIYVKENLKLHLL